MDRIPANGSFLMNHETWTFCSHVNGIAFSSLSMWTAHWAPMNLSKQCTDSLIHYSAHATATIEALMPSHSIKIS
jgi:hypothetical protein